MQIYARYRIIKTTSDRIFKLKQARWERSFKMKKTLHTCFCAALSVILLFSGTIPAFADGTSGYASPEDAVTAYLEAFGNQNLDELLAVFGAEYTAGRLDLPKLIERQRMYYYHNDWIADSGNLAEQLNIEAVRNNAVDIIRAHYLILTEAGLFHDDPGKVRQLEDGKSGEELTASLFATDDTGYLSDITIAGFLDPALLSESYASEKNQEVFQEIGAIYGYDEKRSVACLFTAGGESYVLLIDAGRIGSEWYLTADSSNVAMHLAIDVYWHGMVPLKGSGLPSPEEILAAAEARKAE